MAITLLLTLSPAELRLLRENSLERVLNNAIFVGERTMHQTRGELSERAGVLVDAVEALKVLASNLWDAARNATWDI